MNKNLLLGIAIVMGGVANAQNSSTIPQAVKPIKVAASAAKLALPYHKNMQMGGNDFETAVNNVLVGSHFDMNHAKALNVVRIGSTGYQLQTNSSVCNRVVRNPDGTFGATWTMSALTDGQWADRGTGYNYFDGTNWSFGSQPVSNSTPTGPTARIENVRTGFTNLGVTSTGGEVVLCHETTVSAMHLDTRAAKGTGAWTQSSIAGLSDTWGRLSVGGSNGHTLHAISSSGLGGGTTMITFHGQTGSINYSRSLDGGTTWDIVRYIIPAIDSSHYVGFGGDSYAIDAKGDTVVIVIGGFDTDVALLKSIDNGNTWTKTIVKQFPIPLYDGATMNTDIDSDGTGDTIETNDASLEVMLDRNGMAHVWYGLMKVTEDPGGTALSYFPYTDGLMYWNEGFGSTAPVMIAAILDLNFTNHPADGMLNVYSATGVLGMGTYQTSLTSFPSAGIDAAGNIFLAYSGLFEGKNDQGDVVPSNLTNAGKSYRHTYIMRSTDNGATWCAPYDVTAPDLETEDYDYREGVYAALPKHIGSNIEIVVQEDSSPGHGVAASGTAVDPQAGTADILYYKIPNTTACLGAGAGINDKDQLVNTISVYPNPASNSVALKFNVKKSAKATLKIYNAIGQEVSSPDTQSVTNGTVINLDLTTYKKGMYFVNSLIDGKTFSQKLIVE